MENTQKISHLYRIANKEYLTIHNVLFVNDLDNKKKSSHKATDAEIKELEKISRGLFNTYDEAQIAIAILSIIN